MEPQSTREGLMSAGQQRIAALSTGLPSIAAGNYTAAWASSVETVLAAHHAQLAGQTTSGMATADGSVAAAETNESDAAATLST
jgi:hypothetical protein